MFIFFFIPLALSEMATAQMELFIFNLNKNKFVAMYRLK